MMQKSKWIALVYAAICVLVTVALGISPQLKSIGRAATLANASSGANQPFRAMAFYQQILDAQPYRQDLWERLGTLAIEAEDYNYAVQALVQAQNSGNITEAGLFSLGSVYQQLGLEEQAVSTWEKVSPDADTGMDVFTVLFEAYAAKGQWDKAAKLCEQWLTNSGGEEYERCAAYSWLVTSPLAGMDRLAKSQSFTEEDDFLQAVGSLINGSDQNPEQIWFYLGGKLQKKGFPLIAIGAYQNSIALAPQFGQPYAAIGLAEQSLGRDGEANIRMAVKLQPEDALVNTLVGIYWNKSGKFELALVYLQKANQLSPNDVQILRQLGSVQLSLGNIVQGLDIWQTAAALNPEDGSGWKLIARYSLDQQLFLRERGLEAARKAILADDDDVEAVDLAGQIYLDLGDQLTGERFLNKAIELDGKYAPAHLHLGLWLAQQNQFDLSKYQLELAQKYATDEQTRTLAINALAGVFP